MSPSSPRDDLDLDLALRDALRARTAPRPDDQRLLAIILAATAVSVQERRTWWILPRSWALVIGSAALVVGAAVTAILAASLLRPVSPLPANGPIVVAREGRVAAVDPIAGAAVSSPLLDRLALSSYEDAAWSPSGDALVVSTSAGVRVTRAGGSSPFFGECRIDRCTAAWFPDGTLAVASGSRIDRVDPVDGTETLLLEAPRAEDILDVAVSPDGSRLAYSARASRTGTSTLRIVDLASREAVVIELPTGSLILVGVTWAADGRSLVGMLPDVQPAPSGAESAAEPFRLDIVRFDAASGSMTPLVTVGTCFCLGGTPGFALAPDGTSFAVVGAYGDDGNGFTLTRWAIDGRDPRVLAEGVDGALAWQPIPAGSPAP